ncbi:MAG: ABC transporter substrate-binding protein [Alphaproteobacteria bacterium]|nr:ABC transporter substrate-binding protein [Alphaproteobacteria bacterium]
MVSASLMEGFFMLRKILAPIFGLTALLAGPATAAETKEIRIAQQYGLVFLPLHVAVDHKLIEKHAVAAGLTDTKVKLIQLASGAAVNDALLSGQIDVATVGATVLITVWDRTRGRGNVRGMMALCDSPILFNTTDPKTKTLRDYTETDRIAVTAVKVTHHAVVLQMAAARALGWENRFKLDPLTVSMSHPDAMAAILAPRHEVRTHAATAPFFFQQLEDPRVRTVINSFDVAGGPHTVVVAYNTEKWKSENPKAYQATVKGLEEAMDWIAKNRRAAAELYVRFEKSKLSPDAVHKMLEQVEKLNYTSTPNKMMLHAEFMHKIGSIRNLPESWKDMFWENVHDRPGS